MRKLTLLLLVSVILGAFLTVEAIAQRSRVSAKQAGGSIFIGKTVRNAQGVVLGKVANIVLTEQGCAEYVILSGKFSGARGRYYPVPWTAVQMTDDPEFLMMDVDIAVLREAPVIKDVRRIDVSQWRTQAHDYFQQHKAGAQPGTTKQRPMEQRGQATEEKTKVSPEKKALQGSQDKRMKKEHTSPSGKPDLKKQTDQREGKKFHDGKQETGPADRGAMDKEKQLQMKKEEGAARSSQQQEKGMQKQLEKEKPSVVPQERKLDIKPETGHPAVPSETQTGGPAQGATPVGPGHSGGKSK
jgi:sporulation protein YlmC with PRC-barrel domain